MLAELRLRNLELNFDVAKYHLYVLCFGVNPNPDRSDCSHDV